MKSIKSFRIIFGVVAAILLIISYVAYRSLNNMIDDAASVSRTNIVMRELEKVISEVKDAESAHRGYQLTNDSTYLEPYYNSKWIALSKLDYVDSLTRNYQVQQLRLDTLRILVKKQYDIIEAIIYDMQDKDRFEEVENKYLKSGNDNMDEIRGLVDRIADTEWQALIRRTNRQDYSNTITPLLIFMGFISAVIAVAYLFTQLYKTLRIKIVAEQELEQNLMQISNEVNEKMRAKESLRRVLDSSPNGILFMEAVRQNDEIVDFQLILGNKTVETIFKRPLSEIEGKLLTTAFPNTKETGHYDDYVEVTNSGISQNLEAHYKDNMADVYLDVNVVKLEDGIVMTLVDTTEKRQTGKIIEESTQKFEAIFNGTFQFISLLDANGVVLEANRTILDYGGVESADIKGSVLWDWPWWSKSNDVQKDLRLAIERAAQGEFVRYESEFYNQNSEVTTIDFSLKPIKEGDHVKLIIFEGRDISEIKEADNERAFTSQLNLTIANSNNFDEAVTSVFDQISTRFEMDYSEVWLPYEGQSYLSEIYYATEHKFAQLHDENQELLINRGEGMVGRVMESLQMEYIEDLNSASSEQLKHVTRALDYGLTTVFAVPILFNKELVLTALFFSKQRIADFEGLLRTIQQISSSIGALLIKKRTQDDIEITNKILASAEDIANMGSWEWYIPKNSIKWSRGVYRIYEQSHNYNPTRESFFHAIHPEDRESVENKISTAIQNRTGFDIVYRTLTKEGTIKHIRTLATFSLDTDGDNDTLYGTIQDITQQKSFEADILLKNDELVKSNKNLEQFAYVASHDLQEPLRKIRAFGDRLVTKYEEALDERGVDYIARMQGAAARMQALIDDLLKYSRVARNLEPFHPIDLNKLLTEVTGDLETRIAETDTQFEIDTLPTLDGDAVQLRQLFQNLISNAIKFTPEDRNPLIKIKAGVVDGAKAKSFFNINGDLTKQFLELKITDNGIGFDQKYAERIFNIFERLHGRNEFQGTGIGLAICQKVAQNHNGAIKATSEVGKGTTFTILLPLKSDI